MSATPRGPRRRDLLAQAAAGLALPPVLGCADPPAEDSTPEVPRPAGIDHLVVIMMENRSFDHYLGALSLEEGRADVDGLTGEEVNLDAEGVAVRPFPLPEPCQEDLPHGWGSSHDQHNGGLNDGFVTEHGGEQAHWAMAYLGRDALPIHYALADHFAVPDAFFCSVMGPTWPNRLYGQCGTSGGMQNNDRSQAPFTFLSVYQALEQAGLGWADYYTDIPFLGLLADHWDTARIGFIEDFVQDAARGELPEFTWIEPGYACCDDHPPHHPGLGQVFLATVLEALFRSPLWERCLVLITYDEHGGYFDHVPPPTTADDHAEQGFDQLGFRVPALIVGPWVKQGVVKTVFDNTSHLRFVCERWGIEPWTARIAAAASLSEALDAERMARNEPLPPPVLPQVSVPEEELTAACTYDSQVVSRQPELDALLQDRLPQAWDPARIRDAPARLLALARSLGVLAPRS